MSASAILDFPNVTLYIGKWFFNQGYFVYFEVKCPFWLRRHFTSKLGKTYHSTLLYNAFFQLSFFFFVMAPNLLALATTLENLGARRLLAKKVNFVPCFMDKINMM